MKNIFEKFRKKSPEFKGLNLENKFGNISLPDDVIVPELKDTTFEEKNFLKNGPESCFVNREKLNGVLLEVKGATLFRAMENRFFVLTKVGNGHLPFYTSKEGTDGKKIGKWYPFFGYTGDWLVKWKHNSETGELNYSDSIQEVQNILNANLQIPDVNDASQKIIYEKMNSVLRISDPFVFDKYDKDKDVDFVKKITGYNPTDVNYNDNSSVSWIYNIVSSLET